MSDMVPYKRPQAQLQTRHQTFRKGAWQSGNVYWSKNQSQSANIASRVLSGLQQAAGGGGGIFSRSMTAIRPGKTISAPIRSLAGKLQSFGMQASGRASQKQGIFQGAGSLVKRGFGMATKDNKQYERFMYGRGTLRSAVRTGAQQFRSNLAASLNPRAARLQQLQKSRGGKRDVSISYEKNARLDRQAKEMTARAKEALKTNRRAIDREAKAMTAKASRSLSEYRKNQELGRQTVAKLGGAIPTKGRAQYLANTEADRFEQAKTQLSRQARLSGLEQASNKPTGNKFTEMSKLKISPTTILKRKENTLLIQGKGGISESAQNKLRQNTRDIKRSEIANTFNTRKTPEERYNKERVTQYNREVRGYNKQFGVGSTTPGINTNLRKKNPYDKTTVVFANSPERLAKATMLRGERSEKKNVSNIIQKSNKQQRSIARLTGQSVSNTQMKKAPKGYKGTDIAGARGKKALELKQSRLDKKGNYATGEKSKPHMLENIQNIKKQSLKLKGFTTTSTLGLYNPKTATGGKGFFKVSGGQVLKVSPLATKKGVVAGVGVSQERSLNTSLKQSNAYIVQKKQQEARAAGVKPVSNVKEGKKRAKIGGQNQEVTKSLGSAKKQVSGIKRKLLFEGLKAGTPEYYRRYYSEIKREKLIKSGKMKGKRQNKKGGKL